MYIQRELLGGEEQNSSKKNVQQINDNQCISILDYEYH